MLECFPYLERAVMTGITRVSKESVFIWRKFGKTLALSMLKYFFEDAYDWRGNKQDYSELFADTEIVKTGDTYLKHMGKYPVISLTLKSGKQSSFDDCIRALKSNLAGEFRRHSFIMQEGPWTKREKEKLFHPLHRNIADMAGSGYFRI